MSTAPAGRMFGPLVGLVVALVVGAAGTTAAPAAAPVAQVSGLTAKQKKSKQRELRNCKRIRKLTRRNACIKRVNKRYRKLAQRKPVSRGRIYPVAVEDSFFLPDALTLKANDWIDWTWTNSTVREGHNVNLNPPFPAGVIAGDFQSPGVVTGPGGRFKRQFTRTGVYSLYCNLHPGMTMTVTVEK